MCSDWVTLFRAVSGESQLRREKDEAGRAWGRRRADWSVFGISKRYQVAAGLGKTGNRELGTLGCSKIGRNVRTEILAPTGGLKRGNILSFLVHKQY